MWIKTVFFFFVREGEFKQIQYKRKWNTSTFKVKKSWTDHIHHACSPITTPRKETLAHKMKKELIGHLVHLTASRELLRTVKKLTYWRVSLSSNLPGESLKARMTSLVYLFLPIISIVSRPIRSSLADEVRGQDPGKCLSTAGD